MTQFEPPSPRRLASHIFLTAAIAFTLVGNPGVALAKRPSKDSATASNTSAKKKTVNKVTYQRSTSEETVAQRDRRRSRECKGMHNAGACLGYTRP